MSLGSNIDYLRREKKMTQEQQNRFRMHGDVAAYIISDDFETVCPEVEYAVNETEVYAKYDL